MILFLNTAFDETTIALFSKGVILDSYHILSSAHRDIHSGIKFLTEKHQCMHLLTAVAVISGPGSYTGLRLAFSAAKGLCFALEIPLLPIDSLKAFSSGFFIAHPNPIGRTLIAIQQARQEEFYWAAYSSSGEDLSTPALTTNLHLVLDQYSDVCGITGQVDNLSQEIKSKYTCFQQTNPNLSACMIIAEQLMANTEFGILQDLQPLYIKEAYITKTAKN